MNKQISSPTVVELLLFISLPGLSMLYEAIYGVKQHLFDYYRKAGLGMETYTGTSGASVRSRG